MKNLTAILIFIGSILLFTNASCSNQKIDMDTIEITGTIQQAGMTGYQYGTHTLTTGDKFFALKSDKINLDDYVDKQVTISAVKIAGYPVDGGPEFLDVVGVK